MPPGKPGRLLPKQRAFVDAYLQCWNLSEAARLSGYKGTTQAGYLILNKPQVAEEIRVRLEQDAMATEEVLKRLADQARATVADFIIEDGDGYKVNWQAIKERGYLVKSIKQTKDGPQLELHDAQRALELIGKRLQLFTDRIVTENHDDGEIRVRFIGRNNTVGTPSEASGTADSSGTDVLPSGEPT